MADDTQRPSDLVPVSPSGYINTETTAGQQEQSNRPTDLVAVDPDYVANQVSPYNTVTGVASAAAAARPLIEKVAGSDATTRRSMEQYLRSQIHHDYPGLDLEALKKEMQTIYGPKSRIATYSEVQDALKAVKGQVPGQPAVDLTGYEKVAKPTTMSGRANQGLKKVGEVIEDVSVPGGGFARQSFRAAGRGGLGFGAGYEGAEAYNKALEGDLGAAIPHASSALGYAGLLATNPKIKGAGAVLAGLPLVGKYFAGDAQAAPMSREDVTGTGFDLATSLLGPASLALSPSQLGDSTLRQSRANERYRPGMSVLEGTTLPPQQRAEGGLVYLAEGGESNTGPFIGYPRITNKPRDPNFKQQTGPILGALDALIGAGPRSDISVLNPQDLKYSESYDKFEPYGIAAMAAPFLGGPMKAVGKAAARELGPKAAGMAEDYLTRIGGIQYAVPPGKSSIAAHEIDSASPVKLSDWAQNRIDEYLVPTQADRMGFVGGPSYSANQLAKPEYKGRAWGSGNKPTATMITNLAKDPRFGGVENQNFFPILGKENMHQSNQIMFDKMVEQFYKDPSKLPPDLAKIINDYMQSGGLISGKKSGFDPFPSFDIRDKGMIEELGKSFRNRALIGQHAFGGEGIGGRKAQIIPYQQILQEGMDPTVANAKTFSVGPRSFKLTGEVEGTPRPDLNHAFPYQLFGKDSGVSVIPTPSELALMDFQNQWRKDTGKTMPLKSGSLPQPGYFEHTLGYKPQNSSERIYPRQKMTENWIKELQRSGMAEGGEVQHFQVGGASKLLKSGLGALTKHPHGQDARVAQALEEYLKGNISQAERINILNQHLPIRQWNELPPNYTDEQIRNALMVNKQPKALAPVPPGMQVGNRLDIPAYTQNNPPVYVDTVHDAKGKPISYNRTGHLTNVDFTSKPDKAVRVGLGTQEQALTPLGAEMGASKSPFALIKGTNVGTSDDEVRRMMAEMMKDPRYTQIGMDPRRHSQFYDKSTGMPVFSAEEKLQSGPLIIAPKKGLETTSWDDPRLNLTDFPGKKYKKGGKV
jgi:hypothetical protein